MSHPLKNVSEEVLPGGGTHNRTSLPQIHDFDAFKRDLKDAGHTIETSKHEPTSLKPTQKHYDPKKVKKFLKRDKAPSKKPIIITKSNHIIDGHHRWQAHRVSDTKVKAHQVSMHVGELIRFLKNKPYVKTAGLRESSEQQND